MKDYSYVTSLKYPALIFFLMGTFFFLAPKLNHVDTLEELRILEVSGSNIEYVRKIGRSVDGYLLINGTKYRYNGPIPPKISYDYIIRNIVESPTATLYLFGTRDYIAGIRTPTLYIDPKYAIEESNDDTGLMYVSLVFFLLALGMYSYARILYPTSGWLLRKNK